jgi:hypothetical protein
MLSMAALSSVRSLILIALAITKDLRQKGQREEKMFDTLQVVDGDGGSASSALQDKCSTCVYEHSS